MLVAVKLLYGRVRRESAQQALRLLSLLRRVGTVAHHLVIVVVSTHLRHALPDGAARKAETNDKLEG